MTSGRECLTVARMNENEPLNAVAAEAVSTEKRPWQAPAMEVFDVASSTLLSPLYNAAFDGGLYIS